MKKIILIGALLMLSSCSKFDKSEEAIVLKIDTRSILKNRTIESIIHIDNSKSEQDTSSY